MTPVQVAEAAIERIRALCMALPEAEERPFGGHTAPSFRIRDKLFVTISEDGAHMTCKAPPGVQQALVCSDPRRFYVPKYVGHNGWVGARLDIQANWDEMAELIEDSYRLTAPKRLAALLDAK